jgi:hypothetical protein
MPGPFAIAIVETVQGSTTAVNPPFTTKVRVTNSSGLNQWARADLGVRIGQTAILSPEQNNTTWNNVSPGASVNWPVPWTGQWSSTHDIVARLWISGDTPAPGCQPDVLIASASAQVTVGLRLVLPDRKKPASTNTR